MSHNLLNFFWFASFELPQAIFQLGVLLLDPSDGQVALITLSMSISLASIFLQVLQFRALSQKEAYPSIFALIQDLSNGTFVSGVNQIRNSTSSILNVTYFVKEHNT